MVFNSYLLTHTFGLRWKNCFMCWDTVTHYLILLNERSQDNKDLVRDVEPMAITQQPSTYMGSEDDFAIPVAPHYHEMNNLGHYRKADDTVDSKIVITSIEHTPV